MEFCDGAYASPVLAVIWDLIGAASLYTWLSFHLRMW